MVKEERLYEIVESKTRGGEKTRTRLNYLGPFEEAKKTAIEHAKKNIGRRYSVFPKDSPVADFQAYYRTTVTCPKCGEIIPIE